ncbi:MAG: hypothetical protein ACR2G7_05035 [Acidimicrobiales bacterium]
MASAPSFLQGPVRVWLPSVAATGAWTVHLLLTASLVELACNQGDLTWVLHVTTAVTAGVALIALGLSLALVRSGGELRFVGQVSLLVSGINLALILLEGSYVLFLSACA